MTGMLYRSKMKVLHSFAEPRENIGSLRIAVREKSVVSSFWVFIPVTQRKGKWLRMHASNWSFQQ